jgi:uncharacterized protein (DUF849 family)
VADALDAAAVLEAVRHVKPDGIINELTALPKHYTPEEMRAAAPRDKEVRVKGSANLLAAACRELPALYSAIFCVLVCGRGRTGR